MATLYSRFLTGLSLSFQMGYSSISSMSAISITGSFSSSSLLSGVLCHFSKPSISCLMLSSSSLVLSTFTTSVFSQGTTSTEAVLLLLKNNSFARSSKKFVSIWLLSHSISSRYFKASVDASSSYSHSSKTAIEASKPEV